MQMSLKYKLYERKDDVWFYDDELADIGKPGILEREAYLWDSALLCMLNNRDDYKLLQRGSVKEIKRRLFEHLLNELDNIKENMKYDLEKNFRVYPLIRKRGDQDVDN